MQMCEYADVQIKNQLNKKDRHSTKHLPAYLHI
jgi:hypothetical protein